MTPEQIVSWMLGLLTLAATGLIKAHFDLRRDLSAFQLEVSNGFANNSDLSRIERAVETVRTEVESIKEIMYEIRADLRAGNLVDRQHRG